MWKMKGEEMLRAKPRSGTTRSHEVQHRPGVWSRIFAAVLFLMIGSLGTPGVAIPGGAGDDAPTAVRQRLAMEQAAKDNPFLLLPHRPNYILPFSYSSDPNEEPFGLEPGTWDKMEIKFQISLKVLMSESFMGGEGNLYAAYTNRSWWQTYNAERSRPFRETNHEPELFLLYDTSWRVLGMRATSIITGISHQSNGQGGTLSRSWNRVYLNLILESGSVVLSLKPWYRIPEREKSSPEDPGGDDNPDISRYMGSGEAGLLYRSGKNSFTLLLRNNFRSNNKGAVELGWSYPLTGKMKGYLQVFDGYGESLIDYDHRNIKVGAGILLADWL